MSDALIAVRTIVGLTRLSGPAMWTMAALALAGCKRDINCSSMPFPLLHTTRVQLDGADQSEGPWFETDSTFTGYSLERRDFLMYFDLVAQRRSTLLPLWLVACDFSCPATDYTGHYVEEGASDGILDLDQVAGTATLSYRDAAADPAQEWVVEFTVGAYVP